MCVLSNFAKFAVLGALALGANARHIPKDHKKPHSYLPDWTVPLDGGLNVSLPAPWSNVTLKWITVTRGTWNFTCSEPTANGTVESLGTSATLFDASPLFHTLTEDEFHDYVHAAVNKSVDSIDLPAIGHVDFTADHTIRYDLGDQAFLLAQQVPGGLINVPAAPLGPTGSAALGWVAGSAQNGSFGAQLAYRVEAAGGKRPASCAGYPFDFYVDYSAETWFYN